MTEQDGALVYSQGPGPLLAAVLDQHRLITRTQCGALSIPVVHHHGSESDNRPGPLRTLRCSEDDGHDGLHRDAICCYRFQTFEDWQVVGRRPRTFDVCSDGGLWPCDTIMAIQKAAAGKREAPAGGTGASQQDGEETAGAAGHRRAQDRSAR